VVVTLQRKAGGRKTVDAHVHVHDNAGEQENWVKSKGRPGDILVLHLQPATVQQPGAPAKVLHVDLYKGGNLGVFRFLVTQDDGADLAEHIRQVESQPQASRAHKGPAVDVPFNPVPQRVPRPLGQPGMLVTCSPCCMHHFKCLLSLGSRCFLAVVIVWAARLLSRATNRWVYDLPLPVTTNSCRRAISTQRPHPSRVEADTDWDTPPAPEAATCFQCGLPVLWCASAATPGA
jgi:hypothetical protein